MAFYGQYCIVLHSTGVSDLFQIVIRNWSDESPACYISNPPYGPHFRNAASGGITWFAIFSWIRDYFAWAVNCRWAVFGEELTAIDTELISKLMGLEISKDLENNSFAVSSYYKKYL